MKIFSYLTHQQILKYAVVCKKWHIISQDSRLWCFVSLRPEISGLHVQGENHMCQIIPTKFGANLRYLETNADLVTPNVLQDLAKKCPNLTHLLLDFAQASQLHDFTDLSAFPTKLKLAYFDFDFDRNSTFIQIRITFGYISRFLYLISSPVVPELG